MVIGAGMTSAIMNPCRPQEMEAVRAANVLNGTDPNCTNWIKTYRDYKPAEAGHGAAAPATPAPCSRRWSPPWWPCSPRGWRCRDGVSERAIQTYIQSCSLR